MRAIRRCATCAIAAGVIGVVSVVGLAPAPATSHAQSLTDRLTVTVEPAASDVVLGQDLAVHVGVTNTGDDTLSDLVVHIDITALDDAGSVDPEDWTATLSKRVSEVAPDQTVVVDWQIQPISPGTFSLYAVVLSSGDATLAASNISRVTVDDRRSLNPNGILPVAVGAPAVVGGLLAVQVRWSRRRRSRPETST